MTSNPGPQIAEIVGALRQLSDPAFRRRVTTGCMKVVRDQLALEFREERDPYGKAWEPLAVRKGRILRKTGLMSKSFKFERTPTGFSVTNQTPYFYFHQEGTRNMPARPMMPDSPPDAWDEGFNDAFIDGVNSVMTAWMSKAAE